MTGIFSQTHHIRHSTFSHKNAVGEIISLYSCHLRVPKCPFLFLCFSVFDTLDSVRNRNEAVLFHYNLSELQKDPEKLFSALSHLYVLPFCIMRLFYSGGDQEAFKTLSILSHNTYLYQRFFVTHGGLPDTCMTDKASCCLNWYPFPQIYYFPFDFTLCASVTCTWALVCFWWPLLYSYPNWCFQASDCSKTSDSYF